MEARLLAGSTLVHLSIKDNNFDFHVHARIPGLNFFNDNEMVFYKSINDLSEKIIKISLKYFLICVLNILIATS